MRKLLCLLVLLGCMLAASRPRSSAGDFKLEPGFTLLFNGKNLDGWREATGSKDSLEGKTEASDRPDKVLQTQPGNF